MWKELEWTVCFNFPDGLVYPNESGGFQYELDKNVVTWTDKKSATDFGMKKAAKYEWFLVPTKVESKIY